eukprot:scaffold48_cov311-Pinguiococcus_pyrenoidosus.AAC.325
MKSETAGGRHANSALHRRGNGPLMLRLWRRGIRRILTKHRRQARPQNLCRKERSAISAQSKGSAADVQKVFHAQLLFDQQARRSLRTFLHHCQRFLGHSDGVVDLLPLQDLRAEPLQVAKGRVLGLCGPQELGTATARGAVVDDPLQRFGGGTRAEAEPEAEVEKVVVGDLVRQEVHDVGWHGADNLLVLNCLSAEHQELKHRRREFLPGSEASRRRSRPWDSLDSPASREAAAPVPLRSRADPSQRRAQDGIVPPCRPSLEPRGPRTR